MYHRQEKWWKRRRSARLALCGVGFVSVLMFLTGFGVGADHEGKWSWLMLPDVLCCLLSAAALTLMSYTLVTNEVEDIIYIGIQHFSLLSLFALSIACGKTGVIATNCKNNVWATPKEYHQHHCAATGLEFYVSIVHGVVLILVLLENVSHLPV